MTSTEKRRNQTLETIRAIEALKRQEQFWDHLRKMGMYPHKNQAAILRLLLNSEIRNLFLQCSRNFGKSTLTGIDAVFWAGMYPRTKYYIIAPFRTQASEIYWESGFLEQICPADWLIEGDRGKSKGELRLRFKNGSFIKLDGADNEAAVRGIKPTRLACDEFQDWKDEVWQAIEPNLLANDATVLRIGTPPDRENLFTKQARYVQKMQKSGNQRFKFMRQTIYDNPLIPRERIEELRQGFVDRGEDLIWRREYLAEFVEGGASAIFPSFSRTENVRPAEVLMSEWSRDRNRMQYITMLDPSSTRFAVAFIVYNPITASFYVMDEILETDRTKITASQLKDRILEKESIWYPGRAEIYRYYDEAAALFALEMADLGVPMSPTSKRQNDKNNNISLIRDMIIRRKLWVADHCNRTIDDILNYHTDDKGKIVKEKDDLVDCLLYGVAETSYSLTSSPDNLAPDGEKRESRRVAKYDESKWMPPPPSELEDVEDQGPEWWN